MFNGTGKRVELGVARRDDQAPPIAHFIPLDEEFSVLNEDWDEEPAFSGIAAPLKGSDYINLDEQWGRYPHIHKIDISSAKVRLSTEMYDRLRLMLIKHQDLWDQRPKPTPNDVETCSFVVGPGAKFRAKLRTMGEPARQELRKQTKEQEDKGIIEDSVSDFSSAVVLIPKKGGGIRFAIDYRALNKAIVTDEYTLPNVQEGLAALGGDSTTPPTYFSTLDIKEAFWSVPLEADCRKYTAFQTPDGLKQYKRMPMGLKTASAVFCRYIDKILGTMKWTQVLAYIDDLLVFGRTTEMEHLQTLDMLFTRLRSSNLTLGADKCTLFADRVKYLGHIVSQDGISPDPDKVKAIEAIPNKPPTAEKLNSAMGLIAYYRKFIKNFATFAKPLHAKVRRKADWSTGTEVVYTEEEEKNCVLLRDALMSDSILATLARLADLRG